MFNYLQCLFTKGISMVYRHIVLKRKLQEQFYTITILEKLNHYNSNYKLKMVFIITSLILRSETFGNGGDWDPIVQWLHRLHCRDALVTLSCSPCSRREGFPPTQTLPSTTPLLTSVLRDFPMLCNKQSCSLKISGVGIEGSGDICRCIKSKT